MGACAVFPAFASMVRSLLPAMPSQQHGEHDPAMGWVIHMLQSIEQRIIRMANDFDAKLADIKEVLSDCRHWFSNVASCKQ